MAGIQRSFLQNILKSLNSSDKNLQARIQEPVRVLKEWKLKKKNSVFSLLISLQEDRTL